MTSARAVPFYCPYCADEDLRPLGATHGGWWCQSCRRAWTLKFLGTGRPDDLDSAGGDPASGAADSASADTAS